MSQRPNREPLRGLVLAAVRRPIAQRVGEALIYLDALTGLPRVRTSSADEALTGGGGGGGGAPTTAQYLVGASDGTLSAERVVTNTDTITWDLGTAGQAKASWASTPRAIFAPPSDFAAPSGWSVSSYGVLQQDARTWQDVADAKTSVPAGWTLQDTSSRLSAADITSGVLTMTHNGGGSDSYGAGGGPRYYRTIPAMSAVTWSISFRLRMTSFSALDSCTRFYVSNTANGETVGVDILATGASTAHFRGGASGSMSAMVSSISSATASAGYWVRLTVDAMTGAATVEYQTATSDTEPTSGWTMGARSTSSSLVSGTVGSWYLTVAVTRGGSGTGPVGKFVLGTERIYDEFVNSTLPFRGAGYSTAAQEFVLYDDVWVGTHSNGDLTTALEARLAAIVNQTPGRSSTWAAKLERTSTPGSYSGGSFTNLGSLSGTVSGTGAYMRVTMRSTAASTAAGGELDLRRAVWML